jgi:hypothetical protein
MIKGLFGKLGLRWFEWLFIGVLVAVSIIGYVLYQKLDVLKEDMAKAEVVMQLNEQKEKQLEDTMELDRAIGYAFHNEQMAAVRDQYRERETVIDTYLATRQYVPKELDLSSQGKKNVADPPPELQEKPSEPPERDRKEVVDSEPVTVEEPRHDTQKPSPDDLDGLQHLVDSMQLAYCRADHAGVDCPTAGSSG